MDDLTTELTERFERYCDMKGDQFPADAGDRGREGRDGCEDSTGLQENHTRCIGTRKQREGTAKK